MKLVKQITLYSLISQRLRLRLNSKSLRLQKSRKCLDSLQAPLSPDGFLTATWPTPRLLTATIPPVISGPLLLNPNLWVKDALV